MARAAHGARGPTPIDVRYGYVNRPSERDRLRSGRDRRAGSAPADLRAQGRDVANGNILAVVERRLEPLPGPPDVIDDEMPNLFYGREEPGHVAAPTGTWTDPEQAVGQLVAIALGSGSLTFGQQADAEVHEARDAGVDDAVADPLTLASGVHDPLVCESL